MYQQQPMYQQPMYQQPMYQQPVYQQQPQINVTVQQQQSGGGGGGNYGVQRNTGEWKNGLFSCWEDCGDCCCAFCCTACYAIYSAGKVEDSTATLFGFLTCLGICGTLPYCVVRGKAREAHGITGSTINDVCAACCCICCTMIQVKREFELDG